MEVGVFEVHKPTHLMQRTLSISLSLIPVRSRRSPSVGGATVVMQPSKIRGEGRRKERMQVRAEKGGGRRGGRRGEGRKE